MDNKLAWDRVVTNVSGNCSVHKTRWTRKLLMKEGTDELHGTGNFHSNSIGYQIISADKLDVSIWLWLLVITTASWQYSLWRHCGTTKQLK